MQITDSNNIGDVIQFGAVPVCPTYSGEGFGTLATLPGNNEMLLINYITQHASVMELLDKRLRLITDST